MLLGMARVEHAKFDHYAALGGRPDAGDGIDVDE